MPLYINPHTHTVYLTGADGNTIKINPGQLKQLPDFFERYVIKKYIRRVDSANQAQPINTVKQKRISSSSRPKAADQPIPRQPRRFLSVQKDKTRTTAAPVPRKQKKIIRKQPSDQPARTIVGRTINEDATKLLQTNLKITSYPISNNIGVGILSYNRPDSLKRLIESIKKYTNLQRTTVFISDDASNDIRLRGYLDELDCSGDFVVIRNSSRLGVAGNTNRLMRCLSRFKYCLLLNDDVEVLMNGWDSLYTADCGIQHFCMRQPGVYGAQAGTPINEIVTKVSDRPHGAVISYTSDVFNKIGYFDEKFGLYGMEHVDWSNRVINAGIQPAGYYDLINSNKFFIIHNEKSAVDEREKLLTSARQIMSSTESAKGFLQAGISSVLPSISCVIPCRDFERNGAITTAINGIRAQRFPVIEIIVSENDTISRIANVGPVKKILSHSSGPFNKSMAFNAGVKLATSPFLLLHDADLVLPGNYSKMAYDTLQSYDACHFGKVVVYLTKECSDYINTHGVFTSDSNCERVVGYFEGGSIACRRNTYWRVGGFCEDFVGYGVEDCEFYDRLCHNCNWKENRSLDFVHMWHGRSTGWINEHQRNRDIGRNMSSKPMAQRINDRYASLRSVGYGEQLDEAMKGTT